MPEMRLAILSSPLAELEIALSARENPNQCSNQSI